jgi:hypothetical protein
MSFEDFEKFMIRTHELIALYYEAQSDDARSSFDQEIEAILNQYCK